MAISRILLTGATGYIGGSVLSTLLSSNLPSLEGKTISVLVRHEDQARVLGDKGVTPILISGLDDLESVRKIASEHDLIVNIAMSFHRASAIAMIQGLADRKKITGQDVHFIHTSGTSNVGDQPLTGAFLETHVFSDKEDIFSYQKYRESITQYDQRTSDVVVTETGLDVGVKTYIIMPPLIYGHGSGLFNTQSIQIPLLIRVAIENGYVGIVGTGNTVWNHVHISDLADFYQLFIVRILTGQPLHSGPKGIYFAESGEHSWRQLANGIASAGVALGAIKSAAIHSLTVSEAGEKWFGGNQLVAELGFGSTSRTRADLAREFGWKPQKSVGDFEKNFLVEFEAILKQEKAGDGKPRKAKFLVEQHTS